MWKHILSVLRRPALWLWLLVIFVGIQLGAGLYEKAAVVPQWASVPGDEVLDRMHDSGMYRAGRAFWPFVSPPVALLAVVNLVLAWRSRAPYRRWWLAAAAVMTTYALSSYGYFVPQMLTLQSAGQDWDAARVESVVQWWTSLNYARLALGVIGYLCALKALSLLGIRMRSAPGTADTSTGSGQMYSPSA
ncbi:Domain of uncharacterised function (DUF1772) [Mycolicibacterium phlei]|jgi:hypothetical protein|uniref:DUF1772 domain-containing protein n=1 Tax=Mycolicibacterium phlei DSM 43239 = CCUG 21000 TaxID=1226750 RepID=A0A5N5V0C9_MYCPH|nr:DUF1772 domain-containing protein [Mycolicibacterium phlei]VEG10309.1 Domain of uncharacterised function (DUF1772) [Mycobacteroides chelonae]AMO62204.1 hypothetical protein MPHLCCUG_03401 [Mycolicibacterium phlei]EID18358.1 hypothetical protein MPHLEI_00385 [Mycolicibacterium phlei RIVM601174]KAB7755345.1 hypothetical protein MPHL21000_13275 [Mycolicibacterium phlei DSM 43239 = CCUG 21000]KXW64847.1 hypothetical protein MPHL43239_12915 [Mycolicibacterium phlei DSM 43239 = CCUG 21000]